MPRWIIDEAHAAALSIGFVIALSAGCRPASELSDSDPAEDALAMAISAPAGGTRTGAQLRPDRLAHHPEREYDARGHVGELAWTDAQWLAHCRDVRTSYNPDHDLRTDALTLTPDDPRWP